MTDNKLEDFLKEINKASIENKNYSAPIDDYQDWKPEKWISYAVFWMALYAIIFNVFPVLKQSLDPSFMIEGKVAWLFANWWKFPMYTFIGSTAITLVIAVIGWDFHIRPMLCSVFCIFDYAVGIPTLILLIGGVAILFTAVCGFMYWLGGVFLLLLFLVRIFGMNFFGK